MVGMGTEKARTDEHDIIGVCHVCLYRCLYVMRMAYVRGDVGSENGIVAISADTD